MRHHDVIGRLACVLVGLVVAACGGGASGADTESAAGKTRDEQRAPDVRAERSAGESEGPLLSMYVAGPLVVMEAEPGHYWAEITLSNQGDAAADVTMARAHFEAWRGDERVGCEPEASELEGPPTIVPGDAIVYRATAHCPGAPDHDDVQVRVSVVVDGAELHRERHYVGGAGAR